MGARFNRDWDDGPVAVGQSGRNDWGLYGMHGNVWEWVSDVWSDPRKVTGQGGGVLRDPWVSGDNAASRVLRGGYWVNSARGVRSASRYGSSPGSASRIDGFRLALSPSHS
ncbi:MAG: SUMF1/EgtB/PvdO family nonheme iron enzyme, partial [Zoogloeaceae bacterium]|jgi:formylglycine-generating enzyme required for sulfatase activity|nr:SUMF1/EgtB/PvdO family nonheme iron enzyme [Zoogloeaceae bacterium]